jgi:hypothetical protein
MHFCVEDATLEVGYTGAQAAQDAEADPRHLEVHQTVRTRGCNHSGTFGATVYSKMTP